MLVLTVQRPDRLPERILTFLNESELANLPFLPPEAVVGVYDDQDELRVNSLFREFLHEAIAHLGPHDPAMQAAARQRGDGRLVFIDDRAPEGEPESEDILGWFSVVAGRIVAGSYRANSDHRIIGKQGLTAVIGALRHGLLEEIYVRYPKVEETGA